jgi:polyhydroxybutyrate depolymerase
MRPSPYASIARLAAAVIMGAGSAAVFAADVPAQPSAGCAAAVIEHGRELHRAIEVNGTRRTYILDVPERVEAHHPAPLLFDFHGFGHSAGGVWQVSKFKELAARDGFITIYPDGLPVHLMGHDGAGWEIFAMAGNRDLAFVTRLLDELERTYCIDRARVFSTGFSNGAFFSNLLGCTMADRFAAIAPVSGGRLTVPCTPARAVPVLIHHGRKDARIDVAQARQTRDAWVGIDGCHQHAVDGCDWYRECRDGAEVGYCEDDGDHDWPLPATDRIWEFFRKHPLAPPPDAAPHVTLRGGGGMSGWMTSSTVSAVRAVKGSMRTGQSGISQRLQ